MKDDFLMIVTPIKWRNLSCIVLSLFLCIPTQASVSLTPDMAAPVPPPNDPNPPVANNTPNDAMIQTAAQSTLSPSAAGVSVTVHHGIVYLKGVLLKENDYLENVSNVFTAPGVKDVNTNELHVQYLQHALVDLRITAKVIGTLMLMNVIGKDPAAWPIHIKTEKGLVSVSGTMTSSADKEHVLHVIRCIKGIGPVSDQILIKPSS